MTMMSRLQTLTSRCGGLRLRMLILGLVLGLAPLLALIPLGGARADSDPCTTGTNGTITCVFNYTGAAQTWTVPDGVTQATFYVFGARGANWSDIGYGGAGGEATATLPLTPGQRVTLMVGSPGEGPGCYVGPGAGGFNGGGAGGGGACPGAGGGGASDVRIPTALLTDRVLVAGGGGGASRGGGTANANGGKGGGLTGGDGINGDNGRTGGAGGNQDGTTGSLQLGQGGAGVDGSPDPAWQNGGGGGGGGYFGGAGGSPDSGGGGGSGYGPSGTAFASGVQSGNGLIVISTSPVPGVAATPDRAPDVNGWYTAPVTMTAHETIAALQTIVTCTNQKYSGPSSSSASVTVSCTDNANNTAEATYSFRYDATLPTTTATLTTGNNTIYKPGDWSNQPVQVSLSASDPNGSGAEATYYAVNSPDCGPSNLSACESYKQPFTISADGKDTLRYFSVDRAGNVEKVQQDLIPIDQTKPAITASLTPPQPASSGWYNRTTGAPTVGFTCSDATSGLAESCPALHPFGEGADQSYTASVEDYAGNSNSATVSGINVDLTAPKASPSLSGTLGTSGWYTGPVTVTWNWADSGSSGLDPISCPATSVYSGPDGTDLRLSATCVDNAANSTVATSPTFKLDTTKPTITATVSPANPASSGWYNAAIGVPTVTFSCGDATSKLAESCPSAYTFGQGANQSYTVSVKDNAGNKASVTVAGINVDLTVPSGSPTLSGTLGTNGWYVGPVTISWNWADAGSSGLADTCPATSTYDGPDSVTASISATCADQAGNRTTATSPTFKLGATPPTIALTSPTDGAVYTIGQHVLASYACDDATSGIATNGCTGTLPNGAPIATDTLGSHSFSVTATDAAGNTVSKTVSYSVDYGIDTSTTRNTPIPLGSVAIFRLSVVDGQGHNLSSRGLTVTALDIAPVSQPWDGTKGNYERAFTFNQGVVPGGGYQLVVNTASLRSGSYVLSFQVAGDPSMHTLQFSVR